MDEIRTSSKELEMTDAMVRQQDLIDNATYDVCCSYLGIADEERETLFPWDMRILAEVRESITDALMQFGNQYAIRISKAAKKDLVTATRRTVIVKAA